MTPDPRHQPCILIGRAGGHTLYLDADGPEAWTAASLHLLGARIKLGMYPHPDAEKSEWSANYERELVATANIDQALLDALPERSRTLVKDEIQQAQRELLRRASYKSWYAEAVRVIEEHDATWVLHGRTQEPLRPLAYQLLWERNEFEYEGVTLAPLTIPDLQDAS